MIWLQLAVLVIMILIGSRLKGIALGLMGILGMFIFVQVFRMRPTAPPGDVMLIIISIVTTAAALQAAGGLDYLVYLAEKIIRKQPKGIIFIAPFTVYALCLFAGTAHIVYSLLPVISEVSTNTRIRPERPLSISVIASQFAMTGSPMSAATAAMAALLMVPGASLMIMKVCIPACIIGLLAGALSVYKMGKELKDDPVFQEKMKDPEFEKAMTAAAAETKRVIKPGAKTAVLIFAIAIAMVVLGGSFPHLVPNMAEGVPNFSVNADGTLKMVTIIEIVTLSAAALIMLITKTSAADIVKASLFNSMASAVISVFGVVWMSSTFMAHNEEVIKQAMGGLTANYPWTFAIAVFLMGTLMFSQSATAKAMMPLGMTLGLPVPVLIAMFPATNSYFFLPGYPTLVAAINIDRTGSTKIGKYVLNHSFMRAGLVTTTVSIVVGLLLNRLYG
ncbi:anaerobic C4-dicarboxylate transporter family protein [Flavihumibacter solisilvae]|uniref:C4-dicarboxylate ABC transporter n=1 Tax=Flavihumibacter solisilvae TaxID=1349421 RepID=A0A0C1LC23_9BACT|nr:anaerobic C4-dicarboxylate transporter family protein [Flavihumibacter solisilvae]KIC93048.1 C4-dicarboxylate ABC transporter [Flavihumibacter solisilvae]